MSRPKGSKNKKTKGVAVNKVKTSKLPNVSKVKAQKVKESISGQPLMLVYYYHPNTLVMHGNQWIDSIMEEADRVKKLNLDKYATGLVQFFVPNSDISLETLKIECINPVQADNKTYDDIIKMLTELQKQNDKLLK